MSKKIIVAIDETDFTKFKYIINSLDNNLCMVKIGSVVFNSIGQDSVLFANKKGFDIFLDLKLHDIPNTVSKTIKGLTSLPIKMLTVHTSGGKNMLIASMEAVSGRGIQVFGVTALTSLSDGDTKEIFQRTNLEQVNTMLDLAESVGIDGVVCSPHELTEVKKRKSLLSITPGIRLQNSDDDQKRVMSPKEACDLGADHLVIGRPITTSENIGMALEKIYLSIQ